MKHDQNPFAPEAATDEPASPLNASAAGAASLDFDPVPVRPRHDGITPDKQREYVEALADSGVARYAAARIGVSEQSVARLRRRADARSFDLACEAARRRGARRLHAIAWERAIEGSIKRHYYHGELKSEERVYDNRLLIYLLGKTEHLLDEPREVAAVAENWEPFVEAMEQGLPPPDLGPAWQRDQEERLAADEADAAEGDEDGFDETDIWEEGDGWLTSFPPPADFDGVEDGLPGDDDYRRTLSEAEEAALEANDEEEKRERAGALARACARRDRYFGFAGGLDTWFLGDDEEGEDDREEAEFSSSRGAEPFEPSAAGEGGDGG